MIDDLLLKVQTISPSFVLSQSKEDTAFLLTGNTSNDINVSLNDPLAGGVDLRGPQGERGPAGQDAAGAVDPGDLTLIFDNKLL